MSDLPEPDLAPVAGAEQPAGKLGRAQRNARVIQLRLAGLTPQAVADVMTTEGHPMSAGAVSQITSKQIGALAAVTTERAEEMRDLHLARLERALAAIWPKVLAGNLQAVDRMVKIIDKSARLSGIDKTPQVSPGAGGDTFNFYNLDPEGLADAERRYRERMDTVESTAELEVEVQELPEAVAG